MGLAQDVVQFVVAQFAPAHSAAKVVVAVAHVGFEGGEGLGGGGILLLRGGEEVEQLDLPGDQRVGGGAGLVHVLCGLMAGRVGEEANVGGLRFAHALVGLGRAGGGGLPIAESVGALQYFELGNGGLDEVLNGIAHECSIVNDEGGASIARGRTRKER